MSTKLQNPAIETVKNALTPKGLSVMANSRCRPTSSYSSIPNNKMERKGLLNLANASEESLRDLCDAAEAAGFGLGNQNTFDETYRKSKKLDTTQFSCNFDPRATKIFDQVQADLIEGQDEIQKVLRPELYKLNVYGEGDFSKAHKDTPRAENMMGSLIIIVPTAHKGGSLVLRQDGHEWTFGAEKMLANSTPEAPVISYVAFYSDTEHEVLPVTSADAALTDKNFLPEGGLLGFGLRHHGKFIAQERKKLSQLADGLKGSDASILRACRELGLDVNIHSGYYEDEELEELLLKGSGTLVLASDEYVKDQLQDSGKAVKLPEVVWVTPITMFNRTESSYMAYRNEPSVGYLYGDVCLIVKVGQPGSRMD
ncbi:hypothetical protein EV421DRAFT_2011466 [Armillaria borealis]|uniref:Prolyl 4-hydroxylase alpha subunit Fe(2+) 2OG dioxygenase domain-containing protein n=1 Tax=Armillaria borealis TaxID=47425 RepID=A0AA39J3C0_9AGAR|nr:hypothetical protein EV421DRAFT_2011466 [Armillaria borealis]